jgi:hypothetical protein
MQPRLKPKSSLFLISSKTTINTLSSQRESFTIKLFTILKDSFSPVSCLRASWGFQVNPGAESFVVVVGLRICFKTLIPGGFLGPLTLE